MYTVKVEGPGMTIDWSCGEPTAAKIVTILMNDREAEPVEEPAVEEVKELPKPYVKQVSKRVNGYRLDKNKIKGRLAELSMTQKDLVKSANALLDERDRMSPDSISNYLPPSARRVPNLEVCRAWAIVLGWDDALDILDEA